MNTKEVTCARCGKPEMVSADEEVDTLTYEEAEPKLLRGQNVRVFLCEECIKAVEAFRKTLGN